MASQPTSRKLRCTADTTSGRVSLRTSLQPFQLGEVVERQVEALEGGTHTAVRDEDSPVQLDEKPTVHDHTRSLDSISAAASLP